MDWGLFDLKSKDNKLLREETVYSSNVSASFTNLLWIFVTFYRLFWISHSNIAIPPYTSHVIVLRCLIATIIHIVCHEFIRNMYKFLSFQWFYYFGMVEDLILRFGWTLSMSLVKAGYVEGELMMTILSPFEVFRRFIWNYFRLENEHLNNCGKFRAVRDISVAPMDCSDQVSSKKIVCFNTL